MDYDNYGRGIGCGRGGVSDSGDSDDPEVLSLICLIFVRSAMSLSLIVHCVNTYLSGEADTTARLGRARASWPGDDRVVDKPVDGVITGYSALDLGRGYGNLSRSSLGLGSQRALPFLRDVIECGVGRLGDFKVGGDGIVLVTNADSVLCTETVDVIRASFDSGGACLWSARRDWYRAIREPVGVEVNNRLGAWSPGVDLFAFTVDWWRGLAVPDSIFPDLVMGCEGWDWVMKFEMGVEAGVELALVAHEFHGQARWFLDRGERANRWNRMLCWKWARGRGDLARLIVLWPALLDYEREYVASCKLFGVDSL